MTILIALKSEPIMMNYKEVSTMREYHDLKLCNIPLFGALTSSQLETLWSYLNVRTYKAGACVFSKGDLPQEVYVVVSGTLDLIVEKNGIKCTEGVYTSGRVFGESAFLGIQPYIATAKVRQSAPAELITLSTESLIKIQRNDPELFSILIMNMAREVSRKYQACLTVSSN